MAAPSIEIHPGRLADVGGAQVRRLLPRRGHRTVGAWCFADHFGPAPGAVGGIGPHPHIGLQTVTWLLEGELVHRDSLGSEQAIRPGQLNLMTAGHAVVHAEEADPGASGRHGVQLWVALPESTRMGPAAFEHHAELPTVGLAGAEATLLVGELEGTRSPARADTDHLGAQLVLHGPATVPLRASAEHAVLTVDAPITLDGEPLDIGQVAYLPPGRSEVGIAAVDGSRSVERPRVLLLGGTPFEFEPVMWWNFVARSREEVVDAYRDWQAEAPRFAPVASSLARIPAPDLPWAR